MDLTYHIKFYGNGWVTEHLTSDVKKFLCLLYIKSKPGHNENFKPYVKDHDLNKQYNFFYHRGNGFLKVHLLLTSCRRTKEMYEHLFSELASLDGKTIFTNNGTPIRIDINFHGHDHWKVWPWLQKEEKIIPASKPKGFWSWFWNGHQERIE